MSKRVLDDPKRGIRLNESQALLLMHIVVQSARAAEKTLGGGCVTISLDELCECVGKCRSSVQRACAHLEDLKLIHIEPRFAEDGGQLCNSFAPTQAGTMVVVELFGKRLAKE